MTTIFLNLGPRQSGGELLADAPFRAFVKFKTAHVKDGGVAVLKLKEGESHIGTATIDWSEAEARRHPKQGGKYLVGNGSLDEFDLQTKRVFRDWQVADLIANSMSKAGWIYHCYDHGISDKESHDMFEAWIEKNL